jgi:sulfatase modifying factor 1
LLSRASTGFAFIRASPKARFTVQESFDPYRKWLGISATEHAPNHYRLLGIEQFEDDPETIAHAAEQRIAYIRTLAIGEHADLSQRILNELASARVCLLNCAKKAEYDARLRSSAVARPAAPPLVRSPLPTFSPLTSTPGTLNVPVNSPMAVAVPRNLPSTPRGRAEAAPVDWSARRYSRYRAAGGRPWLWVLATFGVVLAAAWTAHAFGWINSMPSWGDIHIRMPYDVTESGPADDIATTRAETVSQRPARPSQNAVDLLGMINPVRDAIAGQWRWEGGFLVPERISFSRLEIPYDVPAEYRLTVIVEPHGSGHELYVGLPVSSGHVLLVVDGFGDDATMLYSVQGTLAVDWHDVQGRKLQDGRQSEIVCEVRRRKLEILCDGIECLEWNRGTEVHAIPKVWQVKSPMHLMIGGANEHRILALWLEELASSGDDSLDLGPETRLLDRGTENSSLVNGMTESQGLLPPIAMAPFSATDARHHQESWAKHIGREVEETNSIGMKLVLIPPGEFLMGTGTEEIQQLRREELPKFAAELLAAQSPQHVVTITKPFFMTAFPTTVGQFRRFVENSGYRSESETNGKGGQDATFTNRPEANWHNLGIVELADDCPVVNVTWDDAQAFCQWLSKTDGASYRLPTEAEWEFACRAGTTTAWSFGDNPELLTRYAWGASNDRTMLRPVGQKLPNPFLLFDMHGNVWQWCQDWFSEGYYSKSPRSDPTGPPVSGVGRVVRGGAMGPPMVLRSAMRSVCKPSDTTVRNIGFRVVNVAEWRPTRRSLPQPHVSRTQ